MQNPNHSAVWQFVQTQLTQGAPVSLLYVVESVGSSPGRRGFLMAASTEECTGTIGGGIMEYKLVELSRHMIMSGDTQTELITQYHDKEHTIDQSGMICSGMQRIAIIALDHTHLKFVESCLDGVTENEKSQLVITPTHISLEKSLNDSNGFTLNDSKSWRYTERLGDSPCIHIVGAGHVAQALSELMARLGFYVLIYDDRSDLNTLLDNQSAHKKHVIDYDTIGEVIKDDASAYVVIMTIGYRNDKKVLKQLINRTFYYFGMLGSRTKIELLFAELNNEGYTQEQFAKVRAPIGLPIHSRTPYEIAVSIAAEIVKEKNTAMRKREEG